MQGAFENILFVMFLCGVAVLAVSLVFYYQFLQRRAFMDMARRLNFRYYYRSYAIPKRFAFLWQQRRGKGRHALNILLGRHAGEEAVVFDYCFNTGLGAEKKWHYSSFTVLHHGTDCPSLRIYPKGMLPGLGNIIGFDEVHLDGSPLAENFAAFTTNEPFARAVLSGPVVDYLVRHPDLSLEIDPVWLALGNQQRLVPEDIPRRLSQVEKVRTALPL